MTKRGNTILFMIVATIVNMAFLVFFFILFGVLVTLLMNSYPALQSSGFSFIVILLWFGLSIFCSFFIYSRLVKFATAKFGLEDKLDPIFTPKRYRKNRGE